MNRRGLTSQRGSIKPETILATLYVRTLRLVSRWIHIKMPKSIACAKDFSIHMYTKIGSKQGKLLENMLEIEQT